MKFIVILFIGSISILTKVRAETKLMIDHDGGADDAMALFIAMLYEQYFNGPNVVGLTTTHGNVKEEQTFKNTQWILDLAQRRDIPIYRGATSALVKGYESDYFFGKDGLGDFRSTVAPFTPLEEQSLHAALALIENAKKYEDKLIVISIGSLTNIALAIKLDPTFIKRVKHLYIGASTVYGPNYPIPEFNVIMDVEAYAMVVQQATPKKVTVVPFSSVFDSFNITSDWRYNVLGAISTPIMRAQNNFERVLKSYNYPNWSILDPVTVALAEDKKIINQIQYSKHGVIFCGDQRGINTNNFTVSQDQANVRIVTLQNQTEYQSFLYKVFSAELCTKCT